MIRDFQIPVYQHYTYLHPFLDQRLKPQLDRLAPILQTTLLHSFSALLISKLPARP